MKKYSIIDEIVLRYKLEKFGLLRIGGAITNLCVERLGMDTGNVPTFILEELNRISPAQKTEDDIFVTNHGGQRLL